MVKALNEKSTVFASFKIKPAYKNQQMSGLSLKGPAAFMKQAIDLVTAELLQTSKDATEFVESEHAEVLWKDKERLEKCGARIDNKVVEVKGEP